MLVENIFLGALLILTARMLHVTLMTVRILTITRGMRIIAPLIGFIEALLFAVSISAVVQNLDNLWNLVGYSTGFSLGILLGLAIEKRLAMGYATINIISSHKAHEIAERIRQAGFGATESQGRGLEGKVGIVRTVVRRREVNAISVITYEIDPSSFVTVEQTLAIQRGYLGLMNS